MQFRACTNHDNGEKVAINLKPNKLKAYDEKRHFLAVNPWRFSIKEYLILSQLRSPNTVASNKKKLRFSSSYIRRKAAIRWSNAVSNGSEPATRTEFKNAVTHAFVPTDHVKRAWGRLRKLLLSKSVSIYLAELRNIFFDCC